MLEMKTGEQTSVLKPLSQAPVRTWGPGHFHSSRPRVHLEQQEFPCVWQLSPSSGGREPCPAMSSELRTPLSVSEREVKMNEGEAEG